MRREYEGQELDLFESAINWKAYWLKTLAPYITGDVLEVGSGTGTNSRHFSNISGVNSLTCVEPDAKLSEKHSNRANQHIPEGGLQYIIGTIEHPDIDRRMFDTIIYIDVLEHIEHDLKEIMLARSQLKSGGRLLVLCPAHQYLYSPFDASIGHFRRYNKKNFVALARSAKWKLDRTFYLDSIGYFASATNRLVLSQSMPTLRQMNAWDKWMVPISRVTDPLLGKRFGKSIVGIWTR